MVTVEVRRSPSGRRWDIFVNGELSEGGFWSFNAAQIAAQRIRRELSGK